jgi:DNA polymerase V
MKYSMRGFEMIFQQGYNYQKAGVEVLELVPAEQIQLGLFDKQPTEKDHKLMKSIDGANKTFGKDIVRFGVQDYGRNWHLKQGNLSPSYTTRLDHIPKAI